jgi:hypothetical protein
MTATICPTMTAERPEIVLKDPLVFRYPFLVCQKHMQIEFFNAWSIYVLGHVDCTGLIANVWIVIIFAGICAECVWWLPLGSAVYTHYYEYDSFIIEIKLAKYKPIKKMNLQKKYGYFFF